MRDSSSLYASYPFDAPERAILGYLSLLIRYEDGFIATLNGIEIARRKAPMLARFDATAINNRMLVVANTFEEINISSSIGTLTDTNNTLAIRTSNDSPHSDDLLLDVQLSGVGIPSLLEVGFAPVPTPGQPNAQPSSAPCHQYLAHHAASSTNHSPWN